MLRELRPVRAERVRLDQLRTRADVTEVHVDHTLRRAQVRLFRTAQPRDGACEQRAHPAVRDDRRPVRKSFEESRHAGQSRRASCVYPRTESGAAASPRSQSSEGFRSGPRRIGASHGCTGSIESRSGFTYPSSLVDPAASRLKSRGLRADTEQELLLGIDGNLSCGWRFKAVPQGAAFRLCQLCSVRPSMPPATVTSSPVT